MKQGWITMMLVLVASVWAHGQSKGQQKFVLLTGQITKLDLRDSTEIPAAGVPVEIWANGALVATVTTATKGKYQYRLPFYNSYTIKYGSWPLIRKMVEIDATDFSKDAQNRGFEMNIDIALFEDRGFKALEFLKETPVGKASYSKRSRSVVWDADHTEAVNNRIQTAMMAYKK